MWRLLFASLLFVSCGHAADPVPSGEAPEPSGLRLEAFAPQPRALLAAASRALGGTPLEGRLPLDTPSALALAVEGSGTLARLAASDGPVGLVVLGPNERVAWVTRARALNDDERSRLELSAANVPWARRVAVRGAAGGAAAAALAGDWIVLADDRATLDRALAYLVRTVARRGTRAEATSVLLRFPEATARDVLRPALDARRRTLAKNARSSARDERARHRLPPSIGEPEMLIDELDRWAVRRLSLLRDLGSGEGSITIEDDALLVSVQSTVRGADTPLGRSIADERPGAARGLFASPASSALAWSGTASDAERRATSATLLDAAARTSGARLTPAEHEAWRAVLSAIDDAVGDDRTVAIGTDARGARFWSVAFTPRDAEGGVRAAQSLASALSRGHLAEIVGSIAGCAPFAADAPSTGPTTPRTTPAAVARPAGDGAQIVCNAEPSVRDSAQGVLGWSIRGDAGAFAWGSTVESAIAFAASVRESRVARSGSSIGGDDPDAARWLDAQRDAFLALAVSPSALARAFRGRAAAPPRDRALFALARTPGGLRLRARVPVRAALTTFTLARSLSED